MNSQGSLALDSRDASEFFMINGGSEFDDMSILQLPDEAADKEKEASVHYIGLPTPPPAVISTRLTPPPEGEPPAVATSTGAAS